MTMAADMMKLWFWPWEAARAARSAMETAVATHSVLGARLPMVSAAFADPAGADHEELSRMVSEKVTAFGGSQRALAEASRTADRVLNANAVMLGRLAGGRVPSPMDWMTIFERNVSLAVTLMTLPVRSMAPIHKGVTANARRLGNR